MKTTNVITLQTPLVHSGIIAQSQIHIENILESIGPEITLNLVNDVIGKKGTFQVMITYSLAENVALNTLTLLFEQAKVNNVEREWQENVFYLINNFESKGMF
jgi:hypothetical protein